MSYVVRAMKSSDDSPPVNEYGSALNNDLVAVCSSKPIGTDRTNTRFSSSNHDVLGDSVDGQLEKQIRIVNGLGTLPHQYPFMVIILTNNGAFCGGSLIDPSHVLTAAHCLESDDEEEEYG